MKPRSLRRALTWCTVVLACAGSSDAADRWETGLSVDDDGPATTNQLRHGLPQLAHDLEGTVASPDQDWYRVRVKLYHSYEARVTSGTIRWNIVCPGAPCSQFDRVDQGGAILSQGLVTDDDAEGAMTDRGPSLTVRWTAQATTTEFLRAIGDRGSNLGPDSNYDVEFFDTTYALPRFNNTAAQITVLLIQNPGTFAVFGNVQFVTAAGTPLHSEPFLAGAHGLFVLNTSTISSLAGQAGSALVIHNGPYGGLVGKAVALEPATGFTFDTPLTPFLR